MKKDDWNEWDIWEKEEKERMEEVKKYAAKVGSKSESDKSEYLGTCSLGKTPATGDSDSNEQSRKRKTKKKPGKKKRTDLILEKIVS